MGGGVDGLTYKNSSPRSAAACRSAPSRGRVGVYPGTAGAVLKHLSEINHKPILLRLSRAARSRGSGFVL